MRCGCWATATRMRRKQRKEPDNGRTINLHIRRRRNNPELDAAAAGLPRSSAGGRNRGSSVCSPPTAGRPPGATGSIRSTTSTAPPTRCWASRGARFPSCSAVRAGKVLTVQCGRCGGRAGRRGALQPGAVERSADRRRLSGQRAGAGSAPRQSRPNMTRQDAPSRRCRYRPPIPSRERKARCLACGLEAPAGYEPLHASRRRIRAQAERATAPGAVAGAMPRSGRCSSTSRVSGPSSAPTIIKHRGEHHQHDRRVEIGHHMRQPKHVDAGEGGDHHRQAVADAVAAGADMGREALADIDGRRCPRARPPARGRRRQERW